MATVQSLIEIQKVAAAAVLHAHIAECDQCSGPDDGCDDGAGYESACIDRLDFNPYEAPYREATADSVVKAALLALEEKSKRRKRNAR